MIVASFTVLLALIAAGLCIVAYHRSPALLTDGFKDARAQFMHLLPRLAIGILGSGFLAHLLPKETVLAWFGPNSGWTGTALASLAGALTPGGPVVGFSIGATSLKVGADLPQVVAYVTAWSLLTFNRMITWEIPSMPWRIVVLRVAVSLPFPFLAAGVTLLTR